MLYSCYANKKLEKENISAKLLRTPYPGLPGSKVGRKGANDMRHVPPAQHQLENSGLSPVVPWVFNPPLREDVLELATWNPAAQFLSRQESTRLSSAPLSLSKCRTECGPFELV